MEMNHRSSPTNVHLHKDLMKLWATFFRDSRFTSVFLCFMVCTGKKKNLLRLTKRPFLALVTSRHHVAVATDNYPNLPPHDLNPGNTNLHLRKDFFFLFFFKLLCHLASRFTPLPRQCFTDFTTHFTLLLSQPTSLKLHSFVPLFKWLNYPHPNKWARVPRKELRSERSYHSRRTFSGLIIAAATCVHPRRTVDAKKKWYEMEINGLLPHGLSLPVHTVMKIT